MYFGVWCTVFCALISNLFNSARELDPRLWMRVPTHILDLCSVLQWHILIYVSFGFASEKDRLLTYSEYLHMLDVES